MSVLFDINVKFQENLSIGSRVSFNNSWILIIKMKQWPTSWILWPDISENGMKTSSSSIALAIQGHIFQAVHCVAIVQDGGYNIIRSSWRYPKFISMKCDQCILLSYKMFLSIISLHYAMGSYYCFFIAIFVLFIAFIGLVRSCDSIFHDSKTRMTFQQSKRLHVKHLLFACVIYISEHVQSAEFIL